jgi:hypothetical protein
LNGKFRAKKIRLTMACDSHLQSFILHRSLYQ